MKKKYVVFVRHLPHLAWFAYDIHHSKKHAKRQVSKFHKEGYYRAVIFKVELPK